MSQGTFHSMWGGPNDLKDSVRRETTGDPFDDVNSAAGRVATTVGDVMSDESCGDDINQMDMFNETKQCLSCGIKSLIRGEGGYCSSCGFYSEKPDQFGGIPDQANNNGSFTHPVLGKEIIKEKEVFKQRVLTSKHDGKTNLENGDGGVNLIGVEKRGAKLILKVSIKQRTEKYQKLHVGRRKTITGKWDGEQVRTKKWTTRTFEKDVRIHLIPHPEKLGYKKIAGVYSGSKSDGTSYRKEGNSWHPVGRQGKEWLTLDSPSIKEICKEAIDHYKKYMAE